MNDQKSTENHPDDESPTAAQMAEWVAYTAAWGESVEADLRAENDGLRARIADLNREKGRDMAPEPASEPAAAAPKPHEPAPPPASESAAPDYSMLATRDKLIAAFGSFTDMKSGWFDNLKDTPALLNARRVRGRGGRGHIEEPWFCPFEVMRWLIDPKRRKGRPLSESKGWELLESHFHKVYAANSVADPREV